MKKIIIDNQEFVLLDAKEVSEKLGLSYYLVVRMMKKGELPGKKIGNKWYCEQEILKKYLQNIGGENV